MSLESLTDTHRVKIERKIISRDASGGPNIHTWEVIHKSVPVNIQPAKASEQLLSAQRGVLYTNKIFSARDLDLRKDDRFTDLKTGKYYFYSGFADMAGQGRAFRYNARDRE